MEVGVGLNSAPNFAELSEIMSSEFLNGTWFLLKIDCLSMKESGET